jgi:hypothetical protein
MVSSEYIDSVNQHPRENTVEPIGNEQVDGRQSYNGLEVLDDVGTKLHWRQIRLLMISSTGFFMDAYVAPFNYLKLTCCTSALLRKSQI